MLKSRLYLIGSLGPIQQSSNPNIRYLSNFITSYFCAVLAVVLDPLVFGGHMQSHDDLGDEQLHALGALVMGLHVSVMNLLSDIELLPRCSLQVMLSCIQVSCRRFQLLLPN